MTFQVDFVYVFAVDRHYARLHRLRKLTLVFEFALHVFLDLRFDGRDQILRGQTLRDIAGLAV